MSELRRYRKSGDLMLADPAGKWVSFYDAQAEIHQLNNELTAICLARDSAIRDAKQHYNNHFKVVRALRDLLKEQP